MNGQIFIAKKEAVKGQNINIIDVAANHGQSGGPVIANDGKVVGMLVGDAQSFAEGKSFYIPYSVIQSEWDKYKSTN